MRNAARNISRRWTGATLLVCALACAPRGEGVPVSDAMPEPDDVALRAQMVATQIEARDIRDERVLAAMRRVKRHAFAPEISIEHAYSDSARPIGHRQTISQPYIVALMTELAELPENARVLEVGTGSGYQAAVLAEIADEVFTIEIVPELAESASRILAEQGYGNVHTRTGDGYAGWPDAAPFDAILVTAGAPRVPEPLLDQLAIGGRLVIPIDRPEDGPSVQSLEVHRRTATGFEREAGLPVLFVPMTGAVRDE